MIKSLHLILNSNLFCFKTQSVIYLPGEISASVNVHIKCHSDDERGQRKMARLVGADRRATVAQVTTLYNHHKQRKASQNLHMSNLEAPTAEDHTGFHI